MSRKQEDCCTSEYFRWESFYCLSACLSVSQSVGPPARFTTTTWFLAFLHASSIILVKMKRFYMSLCPSVMIRPLWEGLFVAHPSFKMNEMNVLYAPLRLYKYMHSLISIWVCLSFGRSICHDFIKFSEKSMSWIISSSLLLLFRQIWGRIVGLMGLVLLWGREETKTTDETKTMSKYGNSESE